MYDSQHWMWRQEAPQNGGKTMLSSRLSLPVQFQLSGEVDKPPPVDGRMEEILHQLVNGLSRYGPIVDSVSCCYR